MNLLPVIIVVSAVGMGYRFLFQDKEPKEVSDEVLRESLRATRKNLKALTKEKNRRHLSDEEDLDPEEKKQ